MGALSASTPLEVTFMKTVLLLLCVLLVTACQRVAKTASVSETQIKAEPAAPSRPADSRTAGPQPTEAELRAAIQRNYGDAVTLDHSSPTPFMLGDFNGDNSEDIAIFVKPGSGKLSELNSEYVNWILEDPQHVTHISRDVKRNDLLLAVIHGHKREGWRNDLARETYLLKNAVGAEFATQSINQLRTTGESRSLPQLHGDVIREKLNGNGGIIYWNGAKYAWHPLT